MKTTSLLLGALLIAVTGGCNSASYGPASPDFYPSDVPPFTNSAAPMASAPKVAAATPASGAPVVAQVQAKAKTAVGF